MKPRIIIAIIMAVTALAAVAQSSYELNATRAARAFGFGEWAQASALYELMLAERPDSAATYSRAIVAAAVLDDSLRASSLLERAMAHGVPFDTVVQGVRSAAFSAGHAAVYPRFLKRARSLMPWLARAIDARLLDYSTFRNDGESMTALAREMLAGLPGDPRYLDILARGRLLLGDTAGAETAWREALQADPAHHASLCGLGALLELLGRPDEAAPFLRRAAQINPSPFLP
ncbi:MAG: hypothetical protein K2L99_06905 [Muribaculaceae bacterium]|nr:hypothetical protein [Muribaculaceae bacterium]